MKRFFAKVLPSVIAVVTLLVSCEQTSLEKESAEDSLLSVYGLFGIATGATISVTIDQDPIQPDPVNTAPVTFIVVFSDPIDPATFDEFDINQTGTATGITWAAPTTSDNISWTLEATAVTGGGTIVPAIAAGAAQDLLGDSTLASTSTDNSVTYDADSPAVTINQEAAQADPTVSSPVLFTVVFSEEMDPATFSTADITQGGTASGITWSLTTSDNITWSLSAAMSTSSGTIIPSIAANQAQDLAGNATTASSSTDNSVMFNIVPSAQVLRTGQALCYDENGVVVACGGTGQDADLLKGLAWAAPRFTDNGNGTITDNSTGLIWTADMNLMNGAYSFLDSDATAGDGIVYWQTALDFAAQLNTDTYGSRTDWRIPNILELMSLMNYGTSDVPAWLASFGFSNTGFYYWSSTTYRVVSTGTIAWTFSYQTGAKGNSADKASAAFVNALAVAGSSTILPQTGQAECWNSAGALVSCSGTGQDGEYQEGLPLPGTRFTHNGDGTTTDNLTGLMWTTDKNLMLTAYPAFDTDETGGDGAVYWENALAFIDQLNTDSYAGYSDWRLPNVNELLSVFQHDLVYADLTSLGFVNGAVQTCWSSTTVETNTPDAYLYNILYGNQGTWLKTGAANSDRNVWPVRGN